MSVVTIQVGQCGNQLGASLFDALHEHATPSSGTDAAAAAARACQRSFFRDDGVARAVIVDTEPTAIERVMPGTRRAIPARPSEHPTRERGSPGPKSGADESDRRGTWSYDRGTQVCCHAQGGAANNWAFGYHGHGSRYAEACLDAVRREAEACDRLAGLCVLHSSAGGTGSGLGTYLTEALRDKFPSSFLLNTVVCAHSSGEVILQHYNTLFTLTKLSQCSDGILVVENASATAVCQRLLRIERPSHADLNGVICGSLVGALTASMSTPGKASGDRGWASGAGLAASGLLRVQDKLAHLCPNKDFLFLRASMVPQIPERSRVFTSNSWEALTRRAYQIHITGALADVNLDWQKKAVHGAGAGVGLNQSVASLLTFHEGPARGPGPTPAECFRSRKLYADWSPTPYVECRSPLSLQGHDRAISLISNSQAVLGVLESTAERATTMLSVGAYVHHYLKFGAERADFEEAMVRLQQSIQNYRSLG